MKILPSFSNLSGWYRLWVVASVIWFVFALIYTDPWSRRMPDFVGGYTENNWNEFLVVGMMPLLFFWGIVWVVSGFKKRK